MVVAKRQTNGSLGQNGEPRSRLYTNIVSWSSPHEQRQFYTEKIVLKANSTKASGHSTYKTMNLDAGLIPFINVNSEWLWTLKWKTIKPLEDSRIFGWLWTWQWLFRYTTRSIKIRGKICLTLLKWILCKRHSEENEKTSYSLGGGGKYLQNSYEGCVSNIKRT